jgi:hypothetical protein
MSNHGGDVTRQCNSMSRPRSMHYERAALLSGVLPRGYGVRIRGEDRQIARRVTLYLEGKTPLSAMFFPSRRQLE